MLKGIHKYTHQSIRQRQSSPKLQVYNTALQTGVHKITFQNFLNDTDYQGRLVESCVGSYLLSDRNASVFYWHENNHEVDFVVQINGKLIAIEVKNGKKFKAPSGLDKFSQNYQTDAKLLVGSGGIPLDTFLKTPLAQYV